MQRHELVKIVEIQRQEVTLSCGTKHVRKLGALDNAVLEEGLRGYEVANVHQFPFDHPQVCHSASAQEQDRGRHFAVSNNGLIWGNGDRLEQADDTLQHTSRAALKRSTLLPHRMWIQRIELHDRALPLCRCLGMNGMPDCWGKHSQAPLKRCLA